MEALLVRNFSIQSHKGKYTVEFVDVDNELLQTLGTHYIVDRNVLEHVGELPNCVVIDASEEQKSFHNIGTVIEQLLALSLQKSSKLVAIGGGITQDITCFIANTFMRGIDWVFVPTTLLAQADSCIGSKSSINFGSYKNILGSFTPPNRVIMSDKFLATLTEQEIDSGIGEIIKLYLVSGRLVDAETIKSNLTDHLYNALQIKRFFIEEDEFDTGRRNLLNYGHCFGHAIESATNFGVPHGIAVSMGMDMANLLSLRHSMITASKYQSMHDVLETNYKKYSLNTVDFSKVYTAMSKDKKNTGTKFNIIIPTDGALVKHGFENTPSLKEDVYFVLGKILELENK